MHILSTQRLHLRTMEVSDAEFFLDLVNQPSWIANIGDKNLHTIAQAAEEIRNKPMKMQAELGFSFYCVCLGEVAIGMCGLIKRDSLPEVDIGYAFLPQYWGQGYAYEAASAVRDYAREQLGIKVLMGICAAHNQASSQLLKKLGMDLLPEGSLGEDGPDMVFRMDL